MPSVPNVKATYCTGCTSCANAQHKKLAQLPKISSYTGLCLQPKNYHSLGEKIAQAYLPCMPVFASLRHMGKFSVKSIQYFHISKTEYQICHFLLPSQSPNDVEDEDGSKFSLQVSVFSCWSFQTRNPAEGLPNVQYPHLP